MSQVTSEGHLDSHLKWTSITVSSGRYTLRYCIIICIPRKTELHDGHDGKICRSYFFIFSLSLSLFSGECIGLINLPAFISRTKYRGFFPFIFVCFIRIKTCYASFLILFTFFCIYSNFFNGKTT